MPPAYNPRAAKAIGYLKRRYNDVEIFVEDTASRNMWLLLLRKILPSGINIRSINLMGGRGRVVAACKLDQDKSDPRRRLYITDGDLDFLIGKNKLRLNFYCRLNAYCIENILLNERTIVEASLRTATGNSEEEIATKLQFAVVQKELEKLRSLFIIYAVARLADSKIKTVGHPVEKLFVKKDGRVYLCIDKIRERRKNVMSLAVNAKGRDWTARTLCLIRRRARRMPLSKVVSGKDYLFPYIKTLLCSKLEFRGSGEQIKVALASVCNPTNPCNLSAALQKLHR